MVRRQQSSPTQSLFVYGHVVATLLGGTIACAFLIRIQLAPSDLIFLLQMDWPRRSFPCSVSDCDCPNDGSDKEGTHFVSMDEALDMKQRLARGRSARKNKAKLAMGRKRAGRRIASMKVLKKRAQRNARKQIAKRLTKGVAKTDLSPARKREIEKRLDKPAFKTKINRLVKRTIKDIRKKEIARKRK